jgi:Fe2+ or Zn2+ uptake regulation protein
LEDALIEPLRSALMDAHGFAADMEHFAIFGRCRACRSDT